MDNWLSNPKEIIITVAIILVIVLIIVLIIASVYSWNNNNNGSTGTPTEQTERDEISVSRRYGPPLVDETDALTPSVASYDVTGGGESTTETEVDPLRVTSDITDDHKH